MALRIDKMTLPQARVLVKELRIHVKLERMPISKTAKELMDHCVSREKADSLVVGLPSRQNHFKEKGFCSLL